jgi:adenylate cyclase
MSKKLALVLFIALTLSMGAITALISRLTAEDMRTNAENTNWALNKSASAALEEELRAIVREASLIVGSARLLPPKARAQAFDALNSSIAALAFLGNDGGTAFAVNPRRPPDEAAGAFFAAALEEHAALLTEAARGRGGIAPLRDSPLLLMAFPAFFNENALPEGGIAVFIESDSLSAAFYAGGAEYTPFFINAKGEQLLSSPARAAMPLPEELAAEALSGELDSKQELYKSASGGGYFGAFNKIESVNALALTAIGLESVNDAVHDAIVRNAIAGAIMLLISVALVALYVRRMVRPLGTLSRAAKEIEEGGYTTALSVRGHDEITELTARFIGMRHGIENFEKFTSKALVSYARQGKLCREGVTRNAVVMFAFVRNFEEITERMNADEVVRFINAFLEHTLPAISASGGIVDKFLTQEGLVIMALWGTLEASEDIKTDILASVDAALAIRAGLRTLNRTAAAASGGDYYRDELLYAKEHGARHHAVKLGCAINAGPMCAGQMGTDAHMEYTVIGDTVNVAARLEAPNELFDTDILVSENVFAAAKGALVVEEMPGVKAQGKEKPLRVFALINRKGRPGPASLNEVRAQWGTREEEA